MDCLSIPEINHETWWKAFFEPLGDGRFPLSGSIDLTSRCNLNCAHCYINQPPGDARAIASDLKTAEVKEILDQVARAGCLFLLMTGGEPLLRSDFTEIYQHARQKGLIITLFTNATLMTPQLINMLVDIPPSQIEISMYGATPATYEAVTRIPGSFGRFQRGLDLIADSGLKFVLKSVLMTLNKNELVQMAQFADAYDTKLHYDGTIWPRLDGKQDNFAYRLSIEDMLGLNRNDPKREAGWHETYQKSKHFILRSQRIFSCGAGYRSFHIDSSGRLNVCMMARQPAFAILKMGFEAAWQALGEKIERERCLESDCLSCTAAGLCTQCPGFSQLVYGDDETIVEYVCQLAKEQEQQILQHEALIMKENIEHA